MVVITSFGTIFFSFSKCNYVSFNPLVDETQGINLRRKIINLEQSNLNFLKFIVRKTRNDRNQN